jgi:hypothetical protein
VKPDLEGTRFAFSEHNAYVEAVSPWGNRLRCYEPDPRFGRIELGIPYVEFEVPMGAAPGIARFHREILEAPAEAGKDEHGSYARCAVGAQQYFVYRETDRPLPAYDGHHVQVYLADFSGPHKKLLAKNLVFEETDQWQYRFKDIMDLDSGKLLYTIEHEIRSMTHPLFNRPLVNRNPAQTNRRFAPGHETAAWALAYED